jgi:hypothetical protein
MALRRVHDKTTGHEYNTAVVSDDLVDVKGSDGSPAPTHDKSGNQIPPKLAEAKKSATKTTEAAK